MEHLRLHRAPHRAASEIPVMDGIGLRRGRAHEACGPGRHAFALWAAARTQGPIVWIRPSWQTEHMNPDGMCAQVDPGRVIFVACGRAEDLLWCLEESLRSGAAALAMAELPVPPPLTPVRRLHLAAEAGAATGPAPTGLLLLPGEGGGCRRREPLARRPRP